MFVELFGSMHPTRVRAHNTQFVFIFHVLKDVGQASESTFVVIKNYIT